MNDLKEEEVNVKKTEEMIENWIDDESDIVALHLKQELLPVGGKKGEKNVIFPPTYADIGYNIDTLRDGTKVALVDSVGSQANRMERIFKKKSYSKLVPQIEINLVNDEKREEKEKNVNENNSIRKISLLDLAHRGADATVYSCPGLAQEMTKAFHELKINGNAWKLFKLSPTSLVFGFWDSRGGSGEKSPRLVRSIIRAWDVESIHSAAQFNSIWKYLSENNKNELKKSGNNDKRSAVGLADVPSVFRENKLSKTLDDRIFNLETRVLGGILVNGIIERNITVNLVALRNICGGNSDKTKSIQSYLLALSLIAATYEIDLFLREGCHLRYTHDDCWEQIPRRGEGKKVQLLLKDISEYAQKKARSFYEKGVNWIGPKQLIYNFDLAEAKKLSKKEVQKDKSKENKKDTKGET